MARTLRLEDLPGSERALLFEGREYGATASFFLSRHQPGEKVGLHVHPYEETFIVERGRATFTVGDETVEAGPGEIVIVPPNTPHGFTSSGEERLRQFSIHPSDHVQQEWLEE